MGSDDPTEKGDDSSATDGVHFSWLPWGLQER